MTSKTVLQWALAQWEVVHKVTEAARGVLSESECDVLDAQARSGASRTLERLDSQRPSPGAAGKAGPAAQHSLEEDEPTEIRHLRNVLHQTVVGGVSPLDKQGVT